jgi:hypothetical protein
MTPPGVNASIWALIAVCAGLERPWERARKDRMDVNDSEPLPYIQAAALAEVVVDTYERGDREGLPAVFERLDQLLGEAPQDHDLLVVGFIEDVQGELGWRQLDPGDLYRWLGPRGRRAWNGVIRGWDEIHRAPVAGEPPAALPMPDVQDPQLRKIVRSLYRPPKDGPDLPSG